MRNSIGKYPIFYFLLPVFFVWHGFVEFYDLLPVYESFILAARYMLGTIVVGFLAWLVYKDVNKASLFGFFVLCVYFFFGSTQDLLQKKFPGAFINRYSFIIPVLLVLVILLFIFLKRRRKDLYKATTYLNLLLCILLLSDAIILFTKLNNRKSRLTAGNKLTLVDCAGCPRPDIYFLVTDGYSGLIPLKRLFNYDNSDFEDQLKYRGFFVADSSQSNYNFTVFSVGSTLNLDYLNTRTYFEGKRDLPLAFKALRENQLMRFFRRQGYQVVNYSIFDLEKHPAVVSKSLIKMVDHPIITQTFLYRIRKDLGYHFINIIKFLQPRQENNIWDHKINNQKIDSLVKKESEKKLSIPRFVYAHLVLPHWPYYFDSLGRDISTDSLNYNQFRDKKAYTNYLKYCNKQLLQLIDHIQQHNQTPPIIVLIGDHGCTGCLQGEEKKFETMNLSAVWMPGKDYSRFYRGISNVNLFRVILNSGFGQHLSLLKDSTILIKEPY